MAKLSPKAVARIEEAVEKLFVRAKSRFMGGIPPGAPKHLIISIAKGLSIPGVFQQAARAEGVLPNEDLQSTVTKIGLNYLDAIKERAKARTVQSVQAFLTDAQKKGVDTDVETVLGGQIADLWGSITSDVKKIVESETTAAKNISITDAISKINASAGINDPIVFFIIVKDGEACEECVRLHTMNGKTPRLWKMSEIGSGYHKKGDDSPKATGLHPHCFTSNRVKVLTENGWKRMKEVSVGEKVLTHKKRFKKVVDIIDAPYSEKPTYKISYRYQNIKNSVTVTPEHKFLTQRGWVEAKDLLTTDKFQKLLIPCPFCDDFVSNESGNDSFKPNKTCNKQECRSKLKSKNVSEWHDEMSEDQKIIRAAKCSEGTTRYRETSGIKSTFESAEYWTPERRKKTSDSILKRMPQMLKASASTRISKNQKMAYGWLKDCFREEEIVMEHPVKQYAIDIAFPKHKLGIEIDGKYHAGMRLEKDRIRDENLRAEGWTILRFGLGAKNSIRKSAIIPSVKTILSNHNGEYGLEDTDILSIKKCNTGWKSRVHCLTVEDDESFIVNGIVSHNCRCQMASLMPGYGFDSDGRITYISQGWDELKNQRGS